MMAHVRFIAHSRHRLVQRTCLRIPAKGHVRFHVRFSPNSDALVHCICRLMTQTDITEPFQFRYLSRYDPLK